MSVKARDKIASIESFIPGKSKAALEKEQGEGIVIRLGTNENRFGPSPKVLEALNDKSVDYAQYQDTGNPYLRYEIASYHNVDEDQILFGNGLFETVLLIAQTFLDKGDEVIIPKPTFGWYQRAVSHTDAKVVNIPVKDDLQVDLQAILGAVNGNTKAVFLCNPNNPTGKALPEEDIRSFIEKVQENILLVIDEAYMDYAIEGAADLVPEIKKHDNLLIIRTFSKLYGLASFRVGYALGSSDLIKKIEKVKPPLNVGTPAELAAIASIKDRENFRRVREANRRELERYYGFFSERGIKTVPSQGNFFLAYLGEKSSAVVSELEKRRILIRDGAGFGLEGYVRITVGTPEDNDLLIRALEEIL